MHPCRYEVGCSVTWTYRRLSFRHAHVAWRSATTPSAWWWQSKAEVMKLLAQRPRHPISFLTRVPDYSDGVIACHWHCHVRPGSVELHKLIATIFEETCHRRTDRKQRKPVIATDHASVHALPDSLVTCYCIESYVHPVFLKDASNIHPSV